MCKDLGLCIINGRTRGDSLGRFTPDDNLLQCLFQNIKWTEKSLTDYTNAFTNYKKKEKNDGIKTELLKHSSNKLKLTILKLFNLVLKSGIYSTP